jgi:predicted membrane protein
MQLLKELEGLISSKTQSVQLIFSLVKLEMSLAKLSVYPLIVNIIMLFIVLMTTWGATMMLLAYFCTVLFGSVILAITSVIFLNFLLLFLLHHLMKQNVHNMSFEKTRSYFSKQDKDNDEPKKISNKSNRTNRHEAKTTA